MSASAARIRAAGARLPHWSQWRALPSRIEQRNPGRFALGAIVVLIGSDILFIGLEKWAVWDDRSLHLLMTFSDMAILAALFVCYRMAPRIGTPIAIPPLVLEELHRSQQALETANLAKSRYLANVSHEIRSPLNAIYGYAQLIEQEADVRPQDAARVIRRCAEHMTSIVDSLLDISRVENGVLRVRSEIVRLPDFLEQIVLMMRPAAQAKGLEFVHEISGRLPAYVRTDQSRFRQALINLLSNAIKFTDSGNVTFRVVYRGQTAIFEIADTGPGIAAGDRERVFDPYERVGEQGRSGQAGVGLGLPITKAIVEILGGKLELESTPGLGATFRITMMLGEVANIRGPKTVQRRICGHEGRQRSVLLVDDDPDQRNFLDKFLRSCGFEVVAVADGETGASLCAERPFDLAILDISLPGISGWETAVLLRERSQRDLVVIMASANAREFHHPEHSKPVHDHFLVKPYALGEMAEAIGALLRLAWEWEVSGLAEALEEDCAETALPAEAKVHAGRLRELIRIGHVRGIEAEIGELASAAPSSGRLTAALYAALDEFDLAGMAKLLEET